MYALVDEAGGIADDEVRAQVEDRLLARRPGRSPGEFRTAVRRAVLRADADAAKTRAERARADTYVRTRPAQTDTAWLDAHPPAEDALAIAWSWTRQPPPCVGRASPALPTSCGLPLSRHRSGRRSPPVS